MIDTKELRRLAQAATPGGWYVERGNYVYGCKEVTDGEEEWHPVIACTDDDEVSINFEGNANFIAAANPAVINELLDRLEESESDCLEQARLNGMGASREATLMAKLEAAEKSAAESIVHPAPSFADAYQGAMEEVAIWKMRALEAEDLNRKFVAEINGPAYTCEPTQPAASVPVEAIGKMLADAMAVVVSNGANSISMPDEYVEVAVWLRGISPQPTPARSA